MKLTRNKAALKKGDRFGKLVVDGRVPSETRNTKYACTCDCGGKTKVLRHNLTRGTTTSCGCNRHRKGSDNPRYKLVRGHGDISRIYWGVIRNTARRTGREFTVTLEEIWDLFLQQNRRCALSGMPLIFSEEKRAQTASLDRKDSRLGYIPGNVQWLHKDVNRMKLDYDQDYFLKICRRIARNGK